MFVCEGLVGRRDYTGEGDTLKIYAKLGHNILQSSQYDDICHICICDVCPKSGMALANLF